MGSIKRYLRNAEGATAIEYGLIAAILAVVVIAAVSLLDSPVNGMFGSIVEHFEDIGSEQ